MKETVLDVLVYLFENYFHGAPDTVHDRDCLQSELIDAGFDRHQIGKAFEWLLVLQTDRTAVVPVPASRPVRIYAQQELDRLDAQCLGLLMRLESFGVLDPESRERVLDRAWALEQPQIELEDLKWVVLLVLFNEPGREAEFAWMETQVMGDRLRTN